jgi:glycerol-3-phosphate cytidylyltransferase
MTYIDLKKLKPIIHNLKKEGKKIVFTNGCFDILHIGHVIYLQEAKKLGDILIVGVNNDKSVELLKGKNHPINPEAERAQIIAALKSVDYSLIFNETNPQSLIKQIKPDIHVKGGDYSLEEIPESKIIEAIGGKTVILKEIKEKSTSNVIKKILKYYDK